MRAELLKGHTDLLLLQILDGGPAHGYRIIERLRELSGGDLDLAEGTVYPALHRLERANVIRSSWDDSAARRRRVYEITRHGHAVLDGKRQEWNGFIRAMGKVMAVGHA